MEELDLYKTKIDAFIDYDIFNNINNPNYFENEEVSNDDSVSSNSVKKFSSNFEKYNRMTENLLNIIKTSENDVIQDLGKYDFTYEIFANPEKEVDNLTGRINELEDQINNLERTIGNWAIVNIFNLFRIITIKLFLILYQNYWIFL